MKKTYIKPISQQFFSSFLTETMSPSGTHSIDPYTEKGTMYIGGDDGDEDGYQDPSASSSARERLLWGDGDTGGSPSSGVSLW